MGIRRLLRPQAVSLIAFTLSAIILGSLFVAARVSNIAGAAGPDLTNSSKQVSSATVAPGQVLTYTLAITNTGTETSTVRLTDTLPGSISFVPGSATNGAAYITASNAISWSGFITTGGSAQVSFSGIVNDFLPHGTLITNTAVISDGVNPLITLTPVTTTVLAPPDLSKSSKLVSASSTIPGQSITYTVVLSNTGIGAASVRVTDTLPVSVTYVTGSASSGFTFDSASRSIRWSGVVSASTAISFTYRAVITSPMDNGLLITNTASVDDGNGAVMETAPVTTTISSSPDLSASRLTVNRPMASPGGRINYSMVVSNTGTMNTPARVTDTLPISLTYVGSSLQSTMGTSVYDSNSGSILWAGPALVGVPVTISYQALTPAGAASGTVITNTATVQGAGVVRETAPVTLTVASSPSHIGWQNLGLYGARLTSGVVYPSTGVVLAATGGSVGIYRSTDGGATWLPTSSPDGCVQIVLDTASGVAYTYCGATEHRGVWKTTDAGVTWTAVLTSSTWTPYNVPMALTGATIYFADERGSFYRSSDAGTSWTKRAGPEASNSLGVGAFHGIAVDPNNPDVVYAATSARVYKSNDGGATWADISPAGGSNFGFMNVNPHDPNVVFVGSNTDLYRSADAGGSWTRVNAGSSPLVFHPADSQIMYSGNMLSTDGGLTWSHGQQGGGVLAFNPNDPGIIYSSSQRGAQKSTDGGSSWTEIDTGLTEVSVRGVAQSPRDPGTYIIGGLQSWGITFDNSATWAWLNGGPQPANFAAAAALEQARFYLGGMSSILDYSTDNGATWTAGNLQGVVQNDLGATANSGVMDIALVPGQAGRLLAAVGSPFGGPDPKGGVYESSDAGLTWRSTNFPGGPANVVALGSTGGSTVVYAGGRGGVYTSTVGNTFDWHQTSISTTTPDIANIAVDPNNASVVYAGGVFPPADNSMGVGALYKSTDGGARWTALATSILGPGSGGAGAIAIDPSFTNNVFFSNRNKIYQSVDGGANWSLFSSSNLGFEGVYTLIVPPAMPSPVVTFTAVVSGGETALSWANPNDADFSGVEIRYSTQGFPRLSNEGTLASQVTGGPGAAGIYTQTGVMSNTTYYYSAFAYNTAGRYSLPSRATAHSSAASLSQDANELRTRSASGLPRRPAAQVSGRSIYASSASGLFAKDIQSAGSGGRIYVPLVPRQFVPGW